MNQQDRSGTTTQDKFRDIYLNRTWQGDSSSGPGSDLHNAQKYVDTLQEILLDRRYKIDSVVDIGCGDWALSKHINWGDINYTGVDIVPEIATTLTTKYGSPTISFRQGNLISDELPSADLLIIKDVLQHLPNQAVHAFIATQLKKYRFALITNDVKREHYPLYPLSWPRTNVREQNIDIPDGEWRPLSLRETPFNLSAVEVLTFSYRLTRRTFDIKEVLFWSIES